MIFMKSEMKVLMSAYACEPDRGSEPEVGWRWATEMAKMHEVTVLTRENNREVIENYMEKHEDGSMRLKFEYYDLPEGFMKLKKKLGLHEFYYCLWQRMARRRINRLLAGGQYDLVHFVTFASMRYPNFLRRLSVPVVWGPVGGAEVAPWRLLFARRLGRGLMKEVVRNVATYMNGLLVGFIDPTHSSGGVVLASTPRAAKVFSRRGIRCQLMPTIGIDEEEVVKPRHVETSGTLRVLFVGRLVLLKGISFLIEGFAKAGIKNSILTIVGDGPEREHLMELVEVLGLGEQVEFVGHVPKAELGAIYSSHDVLVAPSLYESGGYMALEAFQHKVPVIAMDVGGLSMSVEESCGVKIPVGVPDEVVERLANAIKFYAEFPDMVKLHGEAGWQRTKNLYSWEKKRAQMSAVYEEVVG